MAAKKKEYDDTQLRLQIVELLPKKLPALFDAYKEWIEKNDIAQGRWKPDFPHFIEWLKR